jgi:hypothetical protein
MILFIFGSSCQSYSEKDFDFNAAENKLFEPFKTGDTLYFENSQHDNDSFLILRFDTIFKKESGTLMAKPAYNTISVSLKSLPKDSFIHGIFKNEKENRLDTEYNSILSITKYPQSKEIEYSISFKKFLWISKTGFGLSHADTLRINNCSFKDYYIISNEYKKQDTLATDIAEIIWTIKDGMVAYRYNNGQYWTKKTATSRNPSR